MNDISKILKKAKQVAVQIQVEAIHKDISIPYQKGDSGKVFGSGFFISKRHIVTNHHVVEHAIRIFFKIPHNGKQNYGAVIKYYDMEKDFAILETKDYENNFETFPIGDSDKVKQGNSVYILGYPLGDINPNLKIVSGMITGWERNRLQHDANTNPGNSGGMVLNHNHEIVGIETSALVGNGISNTHYSVPLNIVKPLEWLSKLGKDNTRIHTINLNFSGQRTTPEIVNKLTNGMYKMEDSIGMLVNKIECEDENSLLKEGDVLLKINDYSITNHMEVKYTDNDENNFEYHKLSEYYNEGDTYTLTFFSRKEKKVITNTLKWKPLKYICKKYVKKYNPILEDVDYEVFGGMIVMELSINNIKQFIEDNNIELICKYWKYFKQPSNKQALIISHIFPTTNLYENDILSNGDMLCKINNTKVHNLEEYRLAMKKELQDSSVILVQNSCNKVDTIDVRKLREKEKELSDMFSYKLSDLYNYIENGDVVIRNDNREEAVIRKDNREEMMIRNDNREFRPWDRY
jgi:S1-C subfamily serine protease